jgi:SAM-dependent methyltransferase
MSSESKIYASPVLYWFNQLIFPLKMVIPQPWLRNIPGITTNEFTRRSITLQHTKGRLLDVGCGTNDLVKLYRSAGGDGTGVDVYPWPGVDHVVQDTSVLPFPDGSFDTVTFVACINHIPNREAVLRSTRRLLAPGGRVLLTYLRPGMSKVWHAWAYWDEDQHERGMKEGEVWGFTHDEMTDLLTRSGYRIVVREGFLWGLNTLIIAEPADRPSTAVSGPEDR